MTDEFDDLKKTLAEDAPSSNPVARKAAIKAGLVAFDAEFSAAAQGSPSRERQRGRFSSILQTLFGRRSMTLTQPRFRYVLAGGASVAVLALVVFGSNLPRQFSQEISLQKVADDRLAGDYDEGKVVATTSQLKSEVDAILGGQEVRRELAVPLTDSESLPRSRNKSAQLPQSESEPEVMTWHAPSADQTAKSTEANRGIAQESFADLSADTGGVASAPAIMMERADVQARIADAPAKAQYEDQGRDRFADIEANPVNVVAEQPVSTFSIDVDTASYAFMRGSLNQGVLPQKDAVRIEELINYFDYDYALPDDREAPFRAHVSVMPTPWNDETQLMSIGIKGYDLDAAEKPHANLVFLIDTSGSMNHEKKLPLLINSFKLLLDSLDADDTVAIVTYAGSAGTALEPTKVSERAKILASLERLRSGGSTAGGSTAGAEGIRQAYLLAEQNLVEDGVNRVILATDGDFNVGITDQEELKSYIERKRETGISLSVLGFGRGNYNDELMQILAQNGNGNAAYIDNLSEARKVLVEEATSTLFTIAKDVKIQIEFNPATVSEYRLIGYETRMLAREDFNNDKIDAGDIGAGHTVTALYELTPVGTGAERIDSLRYQPSADVEGEAASSEMAFLKIRYKLPDSDTSTLITQAITEDNVSNDVSSAPREARFAAAVAGFGQLLRGGRHTGDYGYDHVIALAQGAKGDDDFGYRSEFISLVRLAKSAADLEALRR